MPFSHGLIAAALTILSAGLSAGAASAESNGLRQLGAHVHGAAELIAAADPDGLVVAELSSPAYNLYGFEGAASPEQSDAVARANTRLAEPGLVHFGEGAGCTLTDTSVLGAPEARDTAPHGETPHDHDHAHEDHGDEAGHGDVTVSWSFQCSNPARIAALDLSGLFAAFERLERIEVQYLDAGRAAAQVLTPAGAVLALD
jgi:hypothetical protein